VAEISGRSRGAVKLHNIGDNPMRVEVIEWSLIDSSVILETFDNNEGREHSCAHIQVQRNSSDTWLETRNLRLIQWYDI
jgi:hypothetical protein